MAQSMHGSPRCELRARDVRVASISSQDAIFNLIQADEIAANVVSCAAKKGEQAELSLDHGTLDSDRNGCVYNQGVAQVDPEYQSLFAEEMRVSTLLMGCPTEISQVLIPVSPKT